MQIIIGLGNPGYEGTRHNAGRMLVDLVADKYGIEFEERLGGLVGEGTIGSQQVVLVKTLTYMNSSGECLEEIIKEYGGEVIVVSDDITLDLGRVRVRGHGSAGGHNGLKSIIEAIGSDFKRIKLGIGGPDGPLLDFVLGHFSEEEMGALGLDKGIEALEFLLTNDLETTMNNFN